MAIALTLGTISQGARRVVKIDCSRELSGTELLTGTPTVTERTTTDLTIASKAVSVAAEEVNGASVPAGRVLRFFVSGAKAGQRYTLDISCATTSAPDAETLAYEGALACV